MIQGAQTIRQRARVCALKRPRRMVKQPTVLKILVSDKGYQASQAEGKGLCKTMRMEGTERKLGVEIGSYGNLGSGGREGNGKANQSETVCASECQITLWAVGFTSTVRQL